MKIIKVVLFVIFFYQISFAEYNSYVASDTLALTDTSVQRNWLYLELFGNGGLISLNYERDLPYNLSLRTGIGTVIPGSVLLPILINYSYCNILEFGLGITPYFNAPTGSWGGKFFANEENGMFLTPVAGIKIKDENFIYKFSLTPFYNVADSNWNLSIGISFGFSI